MHQRRRVRGFKDAVSSGKGYKKFSCLPPTPDKMGQFQQINFSPSKESLKKKKRSFPKGESNHFFSD